MTSWQMPVCGLRSVSGHAAPLAKEILLAKPALILSIVNTFKNSIDVGSKSVITTQPRILAFGKKSPKAWTRSQIFSGLPLSLWPIITMQRQSTGAGTASVARGRSSIGLRPLVGRICPTGTSRVRHTSGATCARTESAIAETLPTESLIPFKPVLGCRIMTRSART